jgi:hypothetical protein
VTRVLIAERAPCRAGLTRAGLGRHFKADAVAQFFSSPTHSAHLRTLLNTAFTTSLWILPVSPIVFSFVYSTLTSRSFAIHGR